ncbi:unnamed protein product [Musa acuminata subsp. malaccensis]|uniref:(wild Malaysian banana) hypothetical protein n=1 Tax=Musa acuminata subsp. malaccensis TaxID=214687 RepID=A0A804I2F5_MUSAM|nr:unnamed protein product [Musa acuminata subsp. malaccensis]
MTYHCRLDAWRRMLQPTLPGTARIRRRSHGRTANYEEGASHGLRGRIAVASAGGSSSQLRLSGVT